MIIDGRNVFDTSDVTSHGFQYVSIGRLPGMPDAEAAETIITSLEIAPVVARKDEIGFREAGTKQNV